MYSANVSCPKLVSIENILRLIQQFLVRGGVGCFDEREENRNAVSVSL
jgi:heterodisulfide reductase subunit C